MVNTEDDRFFPFLRKSSKFGIDPTSSDFKPTPGMNRILSEQRRQRQVELNELEEKTRSGGLNDNSSGVDGNTVGKRKRTDDVAPLVDRLKKKYSSKK